MHIFLVGSILPPQRGQRVRLGLLLVSAFVFAALLLFLNLGRWLVVEDPLHDADAIAVLSGNMPSRAFEAARVYKQGFAGQVWLTHSTEPGATLAELSIPFEGKDFYDKQILMREGVPASAIQVLDPPIVNTVDEMETIGAALKRRNLHFVILVTSRVHTRRVRALWNRISAKDGIALVHGVSDDSFDPAHWWRSTGDALDVVREILGLANAWAGLPLRPAN